MKKIVTYKDKYKINIESNREILQEIRNLYSSKYAMTVESCDKLNDLMEKFKMSFIPIKKQEIERVKETNPEAKDILGSDFVLEMEKTINDLNSNGCYLFVHGTSIDCCKSIINDGLKNKTKSILSTCILKDNTDENLYTDILNWPHREYKGLALLAIPFECFGIRENIEPLWENIDDNTKLGGEYIQAYRIKPDFVFGYIDVNSKKIIKNDKFTYKHEYNGLEFDEQTKKIDKSVDSDICEVAYNSEDFKTNQQKSFTESFSYYTEELMMELASFINIDEMDADYVVNTIVRINNIHYEINKIVRENNLTNDSVDKKSTIFNNSINIENDENSNFDVWDDFEINKGK